MAKRAISQVTAPVAVGAAAAAGAAAVAGKVVRDRSARRDRRRERAFRLDDGEEPAEGIRRIARGQLDTAIERLRDSSEDELGEAIHEMRKKLKRVRALVRLVRDQLGPPVYAHENAALRDAGRRFSGVRDTKVLVDALDDLTSRFADELPEQAFAALRVALAADAHAAHERVRADSPAVDELEAARDRVATWPLHEGAGYDELAAGFERIYRRGRKALRRALRDHDTQALHELRKRAKDLWHAAQIARPVDPKRMRRLARRAHELADLLGDDHDLAVLREAAARHSETLTPAERKLLRALVRRRRGRLRRRALKLARRLYRVKPRRVARVFA